MFLRRSFVLVCLLAAATCAACSAGSQVRLWPIFDYRPTADGWSLDLLGPVFSARVAPNRTNVTLRPVASFSRFADESHLTILYPLLRSSWSDTHTTTRLLGIAAIDRRSPPAEGEWRDYVRLPPLLYYRAAAGKRTSLAFFPLYADLADVLGQHRIRTVAFPLFVQVDDTDGSKWTSLPFPFISVSSGPDGHAIDVWPLAGWRSGAHGRSMYALWPLYITRTEMRGDAGGEDTLILAPFYWQSDSPTRRSRGVLGFGYTSDAVTGDERWDFPWPLWHFDRGDEVERISIRPLYVHSRTPTVSTGSVLWPLYRWQTQSTDASRYARHEILLGLWRRSRSSGDGGGSTQLHTLFPIFRYSDRGEVSNLATPALLDALLPSNPHVHELYAPLWQVFTSRRQNQHNRWKLLWGLLADDGRGLQYPLSWELGERHDGDDE